jgi:hypothetical protein
MAVRLKKIPQTIFQRFFRTETVGGLILLLFGLAALGLANSPLAEGYEQLWQTPLTVGIVTFMHSCRSQTGESMSKVVGNWKHFQSRKHGIIWQEGYLDHRLRDDERGEQLSAKMNYIRRNPVAAGLCTRAEDWLWIIERSG